MSFGFNPNNPPADLRHLGNLMKHPSALLSAYDKGVPEGSDIEQLSSGPQGLFQIRRVAYNNLVNQHRVLTIVAIALAVIGSFIQLPLFLVLAAAAFLARHSVNKNIKEIKIEGEERPVISDDANNPMRVLELRTMMGLPADSEWVPDKFPLFGLSIWKNTLPTEGFNSALAQEATKPTGNEALMLGLIMLDRVRAAAANAQSGNGSSSSANADHESTENVQSRRSTTTSSSHRRSDQSVGADRPHTSSRSSHHRHSIPTSADE